MVSAAVAVRSDSAAGSQSAKLAAELAAQLGVPLVQPMLDSSHDSFHNSFHDSAAAPLVAWLQYQNEHLQLVPTSGASGPIEVDFCAGANAHRLQGGAELLVQAVRGRSKQALSVLDATAGLGRDSWVMAGRGLCVFMLERDPVVAALLADGLARAAACGNAALEQVAARLSLIQIDAMSYFETIEPAAAPDVIYLDPMFPASQKSALVKKEMRLFQQLLHATDAIDDAAALLASARACARQRVVVKRPRKAECLANATPTYVLSGKAIRFDIYVKG